ncbi:sec-independent protein translocase protein TatA [Mucilaginibacter gracilis]|uniref:Sec-independent protein translocase protein TatA n=1 Tax=Mucilaginibacter gracilis TaxID=423350 RepID=A0A495IWW8_9SPHI|nr:twin-arginine translocase TatA/TatE family subunit [Mucilaginibacter gracilis]RKR81092.1 sec-independent protein translocase protein TatA [Mucilaginibacter gracilis]
MLHSTLLFMSAPDIAIIAVLALVLFGGKKIPELARGLGTGIKEFKDATSGVTGDNNTPKATETVSVPVEQPQSH